MFRHLFVVAWGVLIIAWPGLATAQGLPTPPQTGLDAATAAPVDGVQELMRGPVHEAFAEPVNIDASAQAAVIAQQPPEAVDEIPPDARPEDASAVWIPGYWSWDDVESRYIWISGVWRVPPSGQRWVPGYWTDAQGGFQRVSGFWAPIAEQEVRYLPEPPATLEVGPNVVAPSANHFWIPGCWVYNDFEYRWRPGYWYATNPDWMWIPDRYVWTPRGYVFCNGYWDFSEWARRGCLFAPVYFSQPIYRTVGYYYTPRVLINFGFLGDHFFCRPGYRSYYFGDYYGSSFVNLGFRHWFVSAQFGRGWDPYYNHYRYSHGRKDARWRDHWRDRYDHYSRHDRDRPPHYWKDAKDWERRDGDRRRDWDRNRHVASTVDEAVRNRDRSDFRLTRLDDNQRNRYRENSRELRDLSQQRRDSEGRGDGRQNIARGDNDRNRNRGSFRLPESDQFRRTASRENVPRTFNNDGRSRDGRGEFDRSQLGRGTQFGQNRDGQNRRDTTARVNPPGESRTRITREDLDRVQRDNLQRSDQRVDAARRTDGDQRGLPSRSQFGESNRNEGARRTISPSPQGLEGRQRFDRGTIQPSPEGGRILGQPPGETRRSDGDARQQLDRGRIQPSPQGGRTLGQPPGDFRRGESQGTSGLRFGSPNYGGQQNFGSRDGRQPQTRSFTPRSEGSSQQFGRSQGRMSFEGSPRSTPRFEGSRGGGESRSFRSGGGENRSFRSGGGESRSFRSSGGGDRGRSSAFSGGGGGRGRSEGGGRSGGGGGGRGGRSRD